MPITTDVTTDVGRVRLLISDLDPAAALFADDEVQAFLDLNGALIRLAAAEALDVIASNEALLSKKITTQDLATDGPALAAALHAQAEGLRAAHRTSQADADAVNGGGFGIVPFGRRGLNAPPW